MQPVSGNPQGDQAVQLAKPARLRQGNKEEIMPRWIPGCLVIAVLLSGVATAGPVSPNEVCIYEHEDYVGTAMCHHLGPGMRHKLVTIGGYMNDRASSLHVGKDVHVYLYENANFGGMRSRYDVSVRTLGKLAHWPDINDRVSSMIILPKETWQPSGVRLMKGKMGGLGFIGGDGFYPLPERLNELEARYPHLDWMNDKANFVKLYGDVEVTLYQDANFDGKPLKLPGAGDNMDYFVLQKYQFDGRASSLVVRARGPKQQVIQGQIKLPPALPPRDSSSGVTHRAPPAPTAIAPQTAKNLQPDSRLETDTDRPGLNYRSFDLDVPEPERCQRTCLDDPKCKAWTYVKPGVQGPKARCWLKTGVPRAKPAQCCISGVKPQ